MIGFKCFLLDSGVPEFPPLDAAGLGRRAAVVSVAKGLVPGAGGTASLPRRIGRHRTAWRALAGCWLDAPTALRWGLVDEIASGDGRRGAPSGHQRYSVE